MDLWVSTILFWGGVVFLYWVFNNYTRCSYCGQSGWKSSMKRTMKKRPGGRTRYMPGWIINYYHPDCYNKFKAEEKQKEKLWNTRIKAENKWVKRYFNISEPHQVPYQLPEPPVTSMNRERLERGLYFFCESYLIAFAIQDGKIEREDFVEQYKDNEDFIYKREVWLKLPEDVKRWFVWRMWHERNNIGYLSQYRGGMSDKS